MKQTLLIIPGFGESATEGPYRELARIFKGEFNVVPYTPKWNYRTATDWLHDLEQVLEKIDVEHTTVVAFSLGAYLALLTAESHTFKKVIPCSLSPFYAQQLSSMPQAAKKFLGKRRIKDFGSHSIPKVIKCPAVFLFGSDDWSFAIKEAQKLSQQYKGIFQLIDNTQHELTKEYIKVITAHIR